MSSFNSLTLFLKSIPNNTDIFRTPQARYQAAALLQTHAPTSLNTCSLYKTCKLQLNCPNAEGVKWSQSIAYKFKLLYKRRKIVMWKCHNLLKMVCNVNSYHLNAVVLISILFSKHPSNTRCSAIFQEAKSSKKKAFLCWSTSASGDNRMLSLYYNQALRQN